MKIETVREFVSGLPNNDTHPYRTGAWRPNHREYNATDLTVVGEIPADLDGVYLRNTENPRLESGAFYHPFDGDGMVHAVDFRDGKATYRNRFIRTAGFEAELAAGSALYAGLLEDPDLARRPGLQTRPGMKDASSTDVVVHNGMALTSFYLCGEAYQLDPASLEQCGPATWKGAFPREGISAHARVDETNGELLFFNYGFKAPFMHYGVVDRTGTVVHSTPIPLPGPRFPHDMAFTENYAILNDLPLFWNPRHLEKQSFRPRFFPDLPSRFAIVPRRGNQDSIRWFEAPPTYVLHFANAFEEGDDVVLDGFPQEVPMTETGVRGDLLASFMRSLDVNCMKTRLSRWRFNMKTGETRHEALSATISEFPSINNAVRGRPYRYVYSMLGEPGWFLFRGIVRTDLRTGTEQTYVFPKGVFASEAPFAPRHGAKVEDDGYIVTFVTDVANDASECQVFAADALEKGPIARIALPERISSGTHAYFAPRHLLK